MIHCKPNMYVPSFIVKKCDDPGAFSGGGAGLKLAGAAGLCKVGDQAAGGLLGSYGIWTVMLKLDGSAVWS